MSVEQNWKRIHDKLLQVMQQYQHLQKENDRLQKELRELKIKKGAQENYISELELKVAALKTATGQLADEDKKDLEKRLNQYIRDIDRCIAMLGD